MRIGLVGWFGYGAFSDDMIGLTTKNIFEKVKPSVKVSFVKPEQFNRPDELNSNYDIIIFCGGSYLGHCKFSPLWNIQRWNKVVHVPTFIFGAAYRYEKEHEPLVAPFWNNLQLLLNRSEITLLRGYRTVHWCLMNGIKVGKNVHVGDPVLCQDLDRSNKRNVIGANVRNMPTIESQYLTNEKVHYRMAGIYDYLIHNLDIPVEFYFFRDKSDDDMYGAIKTADFMKYKDRIRFKKPFKTAEEAFSAIDTKYWVGQRLHPTVYAAAKGIKFIGVDTQFEKIWDFMSAIKCDNFIFISEPDNIDIIFEKINSDYMDYVSTQISIKQVEIYSVAREILDLF